MTDPSDTPQGPGTPSADQPRTPDAPLSAPLGTPARPTAGQQWHVLHLWQIQMVRDVLIIGGIVGLVYLGYLLSIVTVPLLLAMALAYLFEPIVRWATRDSRYMTRSGAVATIILLSGALVIVPSILGVGFAVGQGVQYARELAANIDLVNRAVRGDERAEALLEPTWRRIAQEWRELQQKNGEAAAPPADSSSSPEKAAPPAPPTSPLSPVAPVGTELTFRFGPGMRFGLGFGPAASELAPEEEDGASVAQVVGDVAALGSVDTPQGMLAWTASWVQRNADAISRRVLGTTTSAFEAAVNTFTTIGMFLFTLFLTAFFFYFLSTGYGAVVQFWDELIPEHKRGRVFYLLGKMDRVIAGFIRGRLVVCACLVVIYTIGYWLVGVPAPLIIGPIVGIFAIVPYLSLVGVPLSIVMMWLDPPGAWRGEIWWILAAPIGVYVLGQALDDYILTPLIQGRSTGMDTPTILFASLAGGALAGFYGLLLAVPVAACLKILLQEIFLPRLRAWVAGRAEDVLPIAKQ